MTLIWFETTPETIANLLPPDSAYFPPAVFLRNYEFLEMDQAEFEAFCASQGGSIIPGWNECMVQPFGNKLMMTLALLDYEDTSCYGPYREVIFLIPSVTVDPVAGSIPYSPDPANWQYHYDLSPALGYPGEWHIGLYIPYLWLSSDGPVAAGRETWGYPKKMADIKYEDKNGKRTWKVERTLNSPSPIWEHVGGDHSSILHKGAHTEPIIEAWVQPDTTTPRHPDEVRFPPLYVNKIIPNVKGNCSDINELNLVPLDPQTSAGTAGYAPFVTFGPADIELIGGPDDPINQIDVVHVYGGYQFRYNFDLSAGRTLIDYLAE
jgi:hypothetical protein